MPALDAVKNFLSSADQKPSTEVCTETGPAVTQEHVTGHVHQEDATAIDRERHIHHHQHRVQPVSDTVHQNTQHETSIQPEITRETKAEISPEKAELLEGLKHQHKDTRTVGPTERTAESVGATVNEHEHHHVHEHITPVIQRETHEHKVIHNVIPQHEKIHEAPIVHESTVLPTVPLSEFKAQVGDVNTGTGAHCERFAGEPKGSNAPPTEGTIGHHAGAATIDAKHAGHHHQSSADTAERV